MADKLEENTRVLDSIEDKKYIQDTTLKVQEINVEETFESGTIKITPELARQANSALINRIEATSEYTKERKERIDKNYRIYNQEEFSDNALSKVFYPATFNVIRDWLDDLFLTFEKLIDTLELETEGDILNEFIVKKLSATESEDDNKFVGMLRSLAKQIFGAKSVKDESIYYFPKKEVIKTFLKKLLKLSDYKINLLTILLRGIIAGEFCFKEVWGKKEKYKLRVHKENEGSKAGKEYLSMGSFKYEVEKMSCYRVVPIDTRLLIYRKDRRDWIIEKVPKQSFNFLLAKSVDDKNKPKENAIYDFKMLMLAKKHIKDKPTQSVDTEKDKDNFYSISSSEIDNSKIYEYDGDINVIEGHHIPLVLEKGKNPVKCIITAIKLSEKQFIPIRIQPTSYIKGLPYKFKEFLENDKNVSGKGLPENLEALQEVLTGINDYALDMLNMAIWGILFVDKDHVVNPEQLNSLSPRDAVQLKNMRGLKIEDVVRWVHPPVEYLSSAQNWFGLIENILERTSRRGPSGQKITPNPSATEAQSILKELEKSVNTTALNLNELFVEMLENMYVYTMLNRDSDINLKIKGYTKKKKGQYDVLIKQGIPEDEIKKSVDQITKDVTLSIDELFIEGLEFKIKAYEMSTDKQALERQQLMQVIDLLNKYGALESQETTMDDQGKPVQKTVPKVYTDETGRKLIIDPYKLYNKLFFRFHLQDLFTPIEEKQKNETGGIMGAPPSIPGGGAPNVPGSPAPAPLSASPKTGDMLKGVNQIAK